MTKKITLSDEESFDLINRAFNATREAITVGNMHTYREGIKDVLDEVYQSGQAVGAASSKYTSKDVDTLRRCFEDVIWMAARYANGRETYAPRMVRTAVENFQDVFPDWSPRPDMALTKPAAGDSGEHYLTDLFNS